MRKNLKEKGCFDLFNRIVARDEAEFDSNANNNNNNSNNLVLENLAIKNQEAEVINLDTPIEDEKPPDVIITDLTIEQDDSAAEVVEHMEGIEEGSNDKTTEWIRKTEFQLNDENSLYKSENTNDDDKTLKELLDQVAELDEIYTDHQLRKDNVNIENELNGFENSLPKMNDDGNVDFDELFDDAATYTSLQIAFKNPVSITDAPPRPPLPQHYNERHDNLHYDAVEPLIVNPPAPIIDVSPLKRESPPLDEEKLPPLPPKRVKKSPHQNHENNENEPIHENNIIVDESYLNHSNNQSRRGSGKSLQQRPPSQIIIMKTPNQSPLNKKLPPAPPSNSNSLSKQKKPGFFSKLFSRRKSKPDINSNTCDNHSNAFLDVSREPSIHSFTVSAENSRVSTRSNKSLQIPAKKGKHVGRSVSSVSGKRPHLTADIVHIPLKGLSTDSLPMRSGSGALSLPGTEAYERASTATLSNNLDRKTVSALQLADLPLQEGNMELIAIADRQSLKNLCEGEYGVHLDPSVDLTEAEHYALYTSVAPHATESEFDETSCYYAPVEAGEILTQDEVARRLAGNFS